MTGSSFKRSVVLKCRFDSARVEVILVQVSIIGVVGNSRINSANLLDDHTDFDFVIGTFNRLNLLTIIVVSNRKVGKQLVGCG